MTQLLTSDPLSSSVDLTSCDREPIHTLGLVQSFGALIATSLDWHIAYYSENLFELLDIPPGEILGHPIAQLLSRSAVQEMQRAAGRVSEEQQVERLFGVALHTNENRRFVVSLHRNGDHILIDIEPELSPAPDGVDALLTLQSSMQNLRRGADLTSWARNAATLVQELTGYDRVMAYRFLENGDGEVIVEVKREDMEPYLGLRYPASDIPKQARALYERNPIRVIADVTDGGFPIQPTKSPTGEPLDLSQSSVRSVSPIHLMYMRNMGVAASMSVSLLVQGKLWGLIVCHHREPYLPHPKLRAAAEIVGHFLGLAIDELATQEDQEARDRAQEVHDKVVVHFSHDANIIENFDPLVAAMGKALDFDGAMVWINDSYKAVGTALTDAEFQALLPVLNRTANGRQFATDNLASVHPEAAIYADRVSGIIAIPVSRQPRDYLVFCRAEHQTDLIWAGDPTKRAVPHPDQPRLLPRSSFAAWQETRRLHSEPWSKADQRLATGIRLTLLEIALRMSDATLAERQRAQAQQEVLIAELNHRVRNILNLIRNLLAQSQVGAETVGDFTKIVGGRIHALAHAHDLITKRNWNAASLKELIDIETRAYLGDKADRVSITGVDAMIDPVAFTTLALVLHELTTNAGKHGALSNDTGQVKVRSWADADGTLHLEWQELGGPKVKTPRLHSFGTTIIERSIPFELKGTAQLEFPSDGIVARLSIPSTHIEITEASEPTGSHAPEEATTTSSINLDDAKRLELLIQVLVVEDTMLIAMGTEQHLMKLGAAGVMLASNCREGLQFLAESPPTLCILDINLDGEVSTPIAEALIAADIPFVLATGYGSADSFLTDFPDVPIISKPYGMEELIEAVDQVIQDREKVKELESQ